MFIFWQSEPLFKENKDISSFFLSDKILHKFWTILTALSKVFYACPTILNAKKARRASVKHWLPQLLCTSHEDLYYFITNDTHATKLQPKTKVIEKLCKMLKNDTNFGFQLNLRHVQQFL